MADRDEFGDIIEERGMVDRLCAWSAMRQYLKEKQWEVAEVGRPTGRELVVDDDSWKSLPSFGVASQSEESADLVAPVWEKGRAKTKRRVVESLSFLSQMSRIPHLIMARGFFGFWMSMDLW